MLYDVAVIGAGINGSSVAHHLSQYKQKVAIFDNQGIAGGGSGAAGAFVSPKFSKAGYLKQLLGDAFEYSMLFYKENFPHLLEESTLIHIAKDQREDDLLRSFKQSTKLKLNNITYATPREFVSLNAGMINAKEVCNAMCKCADFFHKSVDSLKYENGKWIINSEIRAKSVVLATGAYKNVIDEDYLNLRAIFGHRIEAKIDVKNDFLLHQFVSVSPTNKDGIVSIGATHNVHLNPNKKSGYDVQEGRKELFNAANKTISFCQREVVCDYTGFRSGSFDHIPLLGRLVISKETLSNKDVKIHTKKPNYNSYAYYPNLYMINGSGGYGFVLGPYMAYLLSEDILFEKSIPVELHPARFFYRWAKKNI